MIEIALAYNLNDLTALARSLLQADEIVYGEQGFDEGQWATEWNIEVEAFLADQPTKLYLDQLWRLRGNTPTFLRQALVRPYLHLDSAIGMQH